MAFLFFAETNFIEELGYETVAESGFRGRDTFRSQHFPFLEQITLT